MDARPMRVLRLSSVFEPPSDLASPDAAFDPIGGMQFHTSQLSRALDTAGVHQTILTAWQPGGATLEIFGEHSMVVRLGLPIPRFRQLYSLSAARILPRLAADVDLVHAHLGEDLPSCRSHDQRRAGTDVRSC